MIDSPARTPLAEPPTLRIGTAISLRIHPRSIVVCAVLLVCTVIVAFATLGTGALALTPAEIVATVRGGGDPYVQFALFDLGLPRVAAGALVGAALGIGGALIQSLTRNPLGSPDVIGFDAGAATGAVVALLVFHAPLPVAGVIAVLTGLATALVVYAAASTRTGLDAGYRLILVGIGIGAALLGLNSYLISRTRVEDAKTATRWLAGSLTDSDYAAVLLVGCALVLLFPLALWLARRLRIGELGPEVASALGIHTGWLGIGVLVCAVGISAVAVVAAGPIAFVALAAPQLARRLTHGDGVGVTSAAAMGSLLMVASDFAGQRAFGENDLPVGVVTGVVGGAYLIFILARQWRTRP